MRLQDVIASFNEARDWDEYHDPKDLLLALQTELGELAEHYHWSDDEDIEKLHRDAHEEIREELADVFIYLFDFANKLDIDVPKAVRAKMEKNAKRYPVTEHGSPGPEKQLKFWEPLPSKILNGEKDTTWRVDDDRNLRAGDHLSLVTKAGDTFATAEIVWTKRTTFSELDAEDTDGHESFESDEDMYEQYNAYYPETNIGPDTPLKVVKFSLLDT